MTFRKQKSKFKSAPVNVEADIVHNRNNDPSEPLSLVEHQPTRSGFDISNTSFLRRRVIYSRQQQGTRQESVQIGEGETTSENEEEESQHGKVDNHVGSIISLANSINIL